MNLFRVIKAHLIEVLQRVEAFVAFINFAKRKFFARMKIDVAEDNLFW